MATSAQLRAARAYLRWTMQRSAEEAGITRRTVLRLEADVGSTVYGRPSLVRLQTAYEKYGFVFSPEGGLAIGPSFA